MDGIARSTVADVADVAEAPPIAPVRQKRDAMIRARGDREARALELPVDRAMMIRDAAARIAPPPAHAPVLSLGAAAARPIALPPPPAEARRARLERAIGWLRGKCILVQICDREAAIRQFRVSGRRHNLLAEEVIAHAQALGMASDD